MLHPQNSLVIRIHLLAFPSRSSVAPLLTAIWPIWLLRAQIILLGDPFAIHAVEAADLPPALTTDDVFEVVRAKPVNEDIGSGVTRGKRYANGGDGRPVRRWDVGVRAIKMRDGSVMRSFKKKLWDKQVLKRFDRVLCP